MKKLLAVALLATSLSVNADSDDWIAPFFGGIVLGNTLARPYYPAPQYYAPPPQYFYPPQYYVAPPVYVRPPVYYQYNHHENHHHRHHND